MALPAGIMRELFAIEQATETRNAVGETVQTWAEAGRRWGSYEAISYSEQARRDQVGGSVSAVVRMRFFDGLTGNHRLRWLSRGGKILTISGVIERGHREEHELAVEEQAT